MISVQLEPEDGRFWLLLRDLGINSEGTCKIIVNVHREGLTDEVCIERFDITREHERTEILNDTGDLFDFDR